MATTHFSGPVDSAGGFTVSDTEVIDSGGEIVTAQLKSNAIQTAEVTLTATEIVGTDAGDIGHAAGAVLLAAPGAGLVYEFISAVLIYDFDTAAYTGGADDVAVRIGTTAVSTVIAAADFLGAAADKIVYVNALSAADIALTANATINLAGTAYTQPGTAAGVVRAKINYRIHTTDL